MTPNDFKETSKKHQIQAALEVLSNVVKIGKSSDQNLDVTRSSSLPTLLISIVRNIVKSDVSVPDLLCDLVENISLLCKNGFNKQVGIESIYMKGFIPLLPNLIKDKNEQLQLATLKAFGVFSSLAAIIPLRMSTFYKDISENGVIKDTCEIFKTTQSSNVSAIHSVSLECLSTIVCPVYGDFYSFPWKRGPHDNILEYTEAATLFEKLREQVFHNLKAFDFVSKALAVYLKEDEQKHLEVKCSALRFFIQLLRTFDNQSSQMMRQESALDLFLGNPNFKNTIS
jgi:hypothetical protein